MFVILVAPQSKSKALPALSRAILWQATAPPAAEVFEGEWHQSTGCYRAAHAATATWVFTLHVGSWLYVQVKPVHVRDVQDEVDASIATFLVLR